MRPGQILIGGVILMSVLIALGACVKLRESRTQPVRPHDGDDMIYVPIDQSVLYGVWKNEDINAVIEVSGDKPHMIITENGKLIFEGDVNLRKFGYLYFTDGKDFFVGLAVCSKDVWIYNYDPVTYLGMAIKSIYLDKD